MVQETEKTKKSKMVFIIILSVVLCSGLFIFNKISCSENMSQYKLIDNFNDGNEPNILGGKMFFEATKNASIKYEYYNKNQANVLNNSGYSLKIEYSVPSGEFAKVGMDLNELDISRADKIILWVKGETGLEKFDLFITDATGKKDKVRISNISKFWQKIEIPVSKFSNINLGHLAYIMFDFSYGTLNNKGAVYIDDISFYSDFPNIFEESLMDNISGWPEEKLASKEKIDKLLSIKDNKEFIRQIAQDTWKYFSNIVDVKNHLVLDFIEIAPKKIIGDYTSLTNVGLYLMCVVSAYDLGFLPKEAAIERLRNTINLLDSLPRLRGLWYNYYSTTNLQIGRKYVSSVDNGWLAAGFIVARNAFPEVYDLCTKVLSAMDYSFFYDTSVGQLWVGYDADKEEISPYHYGLLCTEPRVASFIGIGKTDIPKEHWFKMNRALPLAWEWQDQIPKGIQKTAFGTEYFQGYYTSDGKKIVPSWGGSLFEFLMPTLVMKEKELSPEGLGLNSERAVDLQIKYALEEKKYFVWGISPCSTPDGSNGGYAEFGVKGLGVKSYQEKGVITPHVSFLSLYVRPDQAVENLKKMMEFYDVYGEYGFYDALDVNTDKVKYRYMALDQAMSFIAMNNYINDGIIRERFHQDKYIKDIEDLLTKEKFFEEAQVNDKKVVVESKIKQSQEIVSLPEVVSNDKEVAIKNNVKQAKEIISLPEVVSNDKEAVVESKVKQAKEIISLPKVLSNDKKAA
jgi:hypothetical protein